MERIMAFEELPPPTNEECFKELRQIVLDMTGDLEAFGQSSDSYRMDAEFYLLALEWRIN
jgi:hypothetical protein